MRVSDKRRWYAAYVRRRYPRVWASWRRQCCVVKERMAMRRFHAAAARAMLIYEDSIACGPCLRTATYSRVRPGTEYVEYEYKETRWP